MSKDQEKQIVEEALKLIAEGKPLPRRMEHQLSPESLRKLLALVQQLRAEGQAGPHNRTPERLLAMQRIINRWLKPEDGEPTADQVAASTPGQKETESLHVRKANAQASLDQKNKLARLRRGHKS